jgi:hypothetical protein
MDSESSGNVVRQHREGSPGLRATLYGCPSMESLYALLPFYIHLYYVLMNVITFCLMNASQIILTTILIWLRKARVGKSHPRTSHEGPEGE